MTDITRNFLSLHYPKAIIVFYQKGKTDPETYVEFFDIDGNGNPVNAHPLTIREAGRLARALKITEEEQPILKPQHLMGSHILHLDPGKGKAVWFTREAKRQLYFTQSLEIPSGRASVPPMLWVADRNSLQVFALGSSRRPTEATPLYHAPFFNVYENGNVCMGTVYVCIKRTASLEEFTTAWESYFFNSYFSHMMAGYNPIKGNCVSLWKELITTGGAFPKNVLKKNRLTVKDIVS